MSFKRPVIAMMVTLLVASLAVAQKSRSSMSFEDYRKSLRQDYEGYRNQLIENYATYLDGLWEEFEMFKPFERKSEPKPRKQPEITEVPSEPAPLVKLPTPEVSPSAVPPVRPPRKPVTIPQPRNIDLPEHEPMRDPLAHISVPGASTPTLPGSSVNVPTSPVAVPERQRDPHAHISVPGASTPTLPRSSVNVPTTPVAVPERQRDPHADMNIPGGYVPTLPSANVSAPDSPLAINVPSKSPGYTDMPGSFTVPFFDLEVELPATEFSIFANINDKGDYARQWKALQADDVAARFLPGFNEAADEMGLNDYLRYALLVDYAKARFPEASAASRQSLVHYLLVNLGYDARIGETSPARQALIMLPVEQEMVYGRCGTDLGGTRYFVFSEDLNENPDFSSIRTCVLPDAADKGNSLDLRLRALNIPYKPHKYNVEFGGLKIAGEVNANIFPIVYRYPQMPMGDFASSEISPEVRRDIVDQLKAQLKNRKGIDAVNDLLRFVQDGYEYATDQEQFGFEKPYFVEEMLYYDTCDCEDRANFYCYLLWNVLGVENHLLAYPGHESAAVVSLAPPQGTTYVHDGKVFMISDPTYLGSMTGMCMPQYSGTRPEIDYIYK